VKMASDLLAIGREAGYGEEMEWIYEMLSWPIQWSALHGIAEIMTPILKVATRTDATAVKYTVRLGTPPGRYPEEGSVGVGFPYRTSKPRRSGQSSFQRGLDTLISIEIPQPDWYAPDNGFDSVLLMQRAHQPIVALAATVLSGPATSVLDLGCGNGALLKKIVEGNNAAVPYGIDLDSAKIGHARDLHPEFLDNFVVGDMFADGTLWSPERRYTLALLMPGRLLEAPPEQASDLVDRLRRQCEDILVYAYGDWLERYKDLEGLARTANLRLLGFRVGVAACFLAPEIPPCERSEA
ncbi:MAG: class I SAM-dependent methyltransferase, partial [Dehalococcoidia bacterium]